MDWKDPEQVRKYYRDYARRWRDDNRERVRDINRKYEAANAPKRAGRSVIHRRNNIEAARIRDVAWHAAHPESRQRSSKAWKERNPGKKKAADAKRRAAIVQQTPPWADLTTILAIYENCPPGHEVDHIIPLRGRLVSGLHIPENLQYLTAEENRLKSNHFPWPKEPRR